MFFDLHYQLSQLSGKTVSERIEELAAKDSGVYLVAIGGFPIQISNEEFIWAGNPINIKQIQQQIKLGLGLSASLTHTNKSGYSLSKLGDICIQKEHDWAYHWMSLSFIFIGYGHEAELSFSRDTRFKMSWPVSKNQTGQVFIATASIKDWIKFLSHKDNSDWDIHTKLAMKDVCCKFQILLPIIS